jgi:hypothetical protein
MHEGSFCRDIENLGWYILDGPTIQGSRRTVKAFVGTSGEGEISRIGWNVRRKDASVLRCLTVKDIFEGLNDPIKDADETHSISRVGRLLFLEVVRLRF